jgi:hypothetical protein
MLFRSLSNPKITLRMVEVNKIMPRSCLATTYRSQNLFLNTQLTVYLEHRMETGSVSILHQTKWFRKQNRKDEKHVIKKDTISFKWRFSPKKPFHKGKLQIS